MNFENGKIESVNIPNVQNPIPNSLLSIRDKFRKNSENLLTQNQWSDKSFVLSKVQKYGWNLEHASKEFKDDKEIALAAIKHFPYTISLLSKRLQDDEEVVELAVKQRGELLDCASERLKNNKEMIKKAISSNIFYLRFVPKKILEETEILLEVIKAYIKFYRYPETTFLNDSEQKIIIALKENILKINEENEEEIRSLGKAILNTYFRFIMEIS